VSSDVNFILLSSLPKKNPLPLLSSTYYMLQAFVLSLAGTSALR
jgi:hypothetical protein